MGRVKAPQYRSFTKQYGGDPDSTVLVDLHKRQTRTEENVYRLLLELRALAERPQFIVAQPVPKSADREGRIGGSEIPPPPKD